MLADVNKASLQVRILHPLLGFKVVTFERGSSEDRVVWNIRVVHLDMRDAARGRLLANPLSKLIDRHSHEAILFIHPFSPIIATPQVHAYRASSNVTLLNCVHNTLPK